LISVITDIMNDVYKEMSLPKPVDHINYWFNINHRGNYNNSHRHPNSYFSVVYYVKVPNNSGDIVFERPDHMMDYLPIVVPNENTWGSYTFTPEEGMLLVFPSYLNHRVEMNKAEGDDERISIALNFR